MTKQDILNELTDKLGDTIDELLVKHKDSTLDKLLDAAWNAQVGSNTEQVLFAMSHIRERQLRNRIDASK